jgi:hypothetical protein
MRAALRAPSYLEPAKQQHRRNPKTARRSPGGSPPSLAFLDFPAPATVQSDRYCAPFERTCVSHVENECCSVRQPSLSPFGAIAMHCEADSHRSSASRHTGPLDPRQAELVLTAGRHRSLPERCDQNEGIPCGLPSGPGACSSRCTTGPAFSANCDAEANSAEAFCAGHPRHRCSTAPAPSFRHPLAPLPFYWLGRSLGLSRPDDSHSER